jgi:SNF2 family DNA or RNA helicase
VNKRDKVTGLLENPALLEGEPFDPKTPSKIIPRKDTTEKIRKKIYPITFRAKLEDHIDLPTVTPVKRVLGMTPEQTKHYMDMKEALMVEFESGETVSVSVAIAAMTKLRQITGGYLLDIGRRENGSDGKIVHTLKKNPKIEELDSIVEDEIAPDKKILIFAEYRHEIELIVSRYKKYGALSAYGGTTQPVKLDNIKKFKSEDKHRILVIHPKSAAHGVNLTEANYLVFYSISHSAEDNYQAIGRIKRATQKKPMFIYSLIMRDSIDEICYRCVVKKQADERELLDQGIVEMSLLEEIKKSF